MLYLRPTNCASSLTLLNPRRGFFLTLNSITDLLESILAFNSSIIMPKAKNDISHSIQYNIKDQCKDHILVNTLPDEADLEKESLSIEVGNIRS